MLGRPEPIKPIFNVMGGCDYKATMRVAREAFTGQREFRTFFNEMGMCDYKKTMEYNKDVLGPPKTVDQLVAEYLKSLKKTSGFSFGASSSRSVGRGGFCSPDGDSGGWASPRV